MSKRARNSRRACPQRGRRYDLGTIEATLEWAAKHGSASAATRFGVSEASVHRWARRRPAGKVAAGLRDAAKQQGPRTNAERTRHGRRYSVAEKRAILEYAGKHGVSAAKQEFSASRWSIYDWQRRRASVAEKSDQDAALAARSSRPKHIAGKLPEERYHLIADTWLKNQALGPRQVAQLLRRNHAVRVGTSTTRRIMEEQGYVPPKIKVEQRVARRYEAVRPNQQCHLDFLQFFLHKVKLFLLLIEDDFSRFIPGWALCEGERALPVLEAVDAAIARHGKFEQMVVDAGSAFFSWRGQSKLERLCGDYGIDYIRATKRGSNSKLEALNANVRKELLAHEFDDVADAHAKIARWVHSYNYDRVHEGLGGLLVPADRFLGRTEEVLAQLERGEPVVAPGPLSLDTRTLELFRVISRGGHPELWLLGERVWP